MPPATRTREKANLPTQPRPAPALAAEWAAWCRFARPSKIFKDPGPCPPEVSSRFRPFREAAGRDGELDEQSLYALHRGVPLLLAALAWDRPRVGGGSEDRACMDGPRGEQWRLVMAYGGFETLARALLAYHVRKGLTPELFASLVAAVELPPFEPINAPTPARCAIDEWVADGGDSLLAFLGVENGDAGTIRHWLVERRPITDWMRAICLAKALRNASAHGALSASKVHQWKLVGPMHRLVAVLGDVATAAVRRLNGADGRSTAPPG